MIIKFSDEIRAACHGFQIPQEEKEPEFFVVMTDSGPVKMKGTQTRRSDPLPTLTEADVEGVPDWLKEALTQGANIVMSREDFMSLPTEVQEHADVVTY